MFPNPYDIEVEETHKGDEVDGSLKSQSEEDKLMKSVLEAQEKRIQEGMMINESISRGIMSFNPDLMYANVVKNYQLAEDLYGERLLRLLSGYEPDYIKKNIRIPEFARELFKNIKESIEELQDSGLLNREGDVTDDGLAIASFSLYMEELDNLAPKGIVGHAIHKQHSHYGESVDRRPYKPHDRYKDLELRSSVNRAIKRNHTTLRREDLDIKVRQKKGNICVIYALDASGSMKGDKIMTGKKGCVALAHHAIQRRDKVGLIVFGKDVTKTVQPTLDFKLLLKELTTVRASKQTDLVPMIQKAIELFPKGDVTKHLVLISDALPTVGDIPEEETLRAISTAKCNGITVSIVGISLDDKGAELAKKIAHVGEGRTYQVRQLDNLDSYILEDYYSL